MTADPFVIIGVQINTLVNQSYSPLNIKSVQSLPCSTKTIPWAHGITKDQQVTLHLLIAPLSHCNNQYKILAGGITSPKWTWGHHIATTTDTIHKQVVCFNSRVRQFATSFDLTNEPSKSCPQAQTTLDLVWTTDPRRYLYLCQISKYSSLLWQDPGFTSASQQLMILPDIEQWQDESQCFGLADYSISVVLSAAVHCSWTTQMDSMIMQVHNLSQQQPKQCLLSTRSDRDWALWTRATHSFEGNCAQFCQHNTTVSPVNLNGDFPCTAQVTVAPSTSTSNKPYTASELRSPIHLSPPGVYRVSVCMRSSAVSGLVSGVFLYSDATQEEIDLVEVTGNQLRSIQFNWFTRNGKQPNKFPVRIHPGWNASVDFHKYEIVYVPGQAIVWIVDNRPVHFIITANPPKKATRLVSLLKPSTALNILIPSPPVPIPNCSMQLMLNHWPSTAAGWAGALDPGRINANANMCATTEFLFPSVCVQELARNTSKPHLKWSSLLPNRIKRACFK